MNEENHSSQGLKKLSGFEWFGLISGIVGLIADIISLSALGHFTQGEQANFQVPLFLIGLISFFAISYTLFIFGYYLYRIKLSGDIEPGREWDVENGVKLLLFLIGILFYCLLFVFLFFIVRENIVAMDKQTLESFTWEVNYVSALWKIGMLIAIVGFVLSLTMPWLMNLCAKKLFDFFDK
jgi:hypothetical protein